MLAAIAVPSSSLRTEDVFIVFSPFTGIAEALCQLTVAEQSIFTIMVSRFRRLDRALDAILSWTGGRWAAKEADCPALFHSQSSVASMRLALSGYVHVMAATPSAFQYFSLSRFA
jgi:hypothetical protein